MRRSGFALTAALEEKIELAVCLWLLALVVAFVVVTLHWPMVGDVTFMHYVVFLMQHGMAPYRDIVDMNLPASYLIEAAEMKVLGTGSGGWRVYDFGLMLVASSSLVTILRRQGKLAGILAAALFVLIHGRDGILMTGERDFAGAALLLAAVAFLFAMTRLRGSSVKSTALGFCFGATASFACCIKPTFLPMVGGLLIWTEWMRRRRSVAAGLVFWPIVLGLVLAVTGCFDFLLRKGAVFGFSQELHGLIPYHASINPRSIEYLLGNCLSPLAGLFTLWLIAAWILRRYPSSPERTALVVCAGCGLLSYVLQRKGFWYQRYPLLAFLLPVFMIDFSRLLKGRSWPRLVGFAGIVVGVILATQCVTRLASFQRTPPGQPLLNDLASFGSPQDLSGHVQCMDTIGSCIDNLYAARIVQSTGFLYDCYLLGGQGAAKEAWVTEELRTRFWGQMERNTPRLIVVTDSICYQQAASFDKYEHWPEFRSYLATNYVLMKQSGMQVPVHYWSRPLVPFGYRIYERRSDIAAATSGKAR